MTNTLPVHPRTGLRALGIVRGRAVWPILGADDTNVAELETKLSELTAAVSSRSAEIVALGDKARAGTMTDDEAARFDALEAEFPAAEAELAKWTARADMIARARRGTVDRGSFGTGVDVITSRTPADPFRGVTDRSSLFSLSTSEVASRARALVERSEADTLTDTQKVHLERQLKTDRQGKLARHLIGAGSDAYVDAFESLALVHGRSDRLSNSQRSALDLAEAVQRGVLESSDSAGGFLVPPLYDPTVLHFAELSVNPIRGLVDQRSISGPKLVQPSVGSISVGYLGEAVEVAESVPTFGELTWIAQKFGGYVKASYEALEDTGVSGILTSLLAEAKDEREAHEFLLGDGQAGHIHGIVTALLAAGRGIDTATANEFTLDDLYALRAAVPAVYRPGFSFLGSDDTFLGVRRFAEGKPNMADFWVELSGDTPARLLGKPTHEVSQLAAPGTDGKYADAAAVLVAGDLAKAYRIVDRRGMLVEFDAIVHGPNNRPTGERAWFCTWRTGGDKLNPRAARVLRAKAA